MSLNKVFFVSLVAAVLATASLLSLRPFISGIQFAPDQGFNWYYWKRPDPTFWSRTSMWAGYVAHQLFLWGAIYWAKQNRDRWRDRSGIHPINWILLAGTAGFVALHYLQTAVFYDGLGQDLPVFASQASVVLLLVIVLLLEAPRRGLFLGAGKSWFAPIRQTLIATHGYYFAWATTFTFWYHPMEITGGHLLGFLYTFLLFIQAAFIFTRIHTNRIWTFVLEISVVVHAVTVAWVAGQEFWPMFAFGFLFILVMTQMHGLGLSARARWSITALVAAGAAAVYSQRGWEHLNEIIRIPAIDYALVFLIGGVLLLINRLRKS